MKTIIVTCASGNMEQALVKKFLIKGFRVIGTTNSTQRPGKDRNRRCQF